MCITHTLIQIWHCTAKDLATYHYVLVPALRAGAGGNFFRLLILIKYQILIVIFLFIMQKR
jgi:hypothetical protein